jgi:hypothetical protein
MHLFTISTKTATSCSGRFESKTFQFSSLEEAPGREAKEGGGSRRQRRRDDGGERGAAGSLYQGLRLPFVMKIPSNYKDIAVKLGTTYITAKIAKLN